MYKALAGCANWLDPGSGCRLWQLDISAENFYVLHVNFMHNYSLLLRNRVVFRRGYSPSERSSVYCSKLTPMLPKEFSEGVENTRLYRKARNVRPPTTSK